MDEFTAQVSGVGALAEPARRALYLYVVAQPEPVGRDQAAAGTGLPRHTAKFHLDKLVTDGLLDTEYRRLSGRRGPGAGRPTKLYRRSSRQVAVTLPPRHYEMAGQILARAVEDAARDGVPVLQAVQHAAVDAGHRLGAAQRPRDEGSATPSGDAAARDDAAALDDRAALDAAAGLDDITAVLDAHGYEPRVQGDRVVLANCPFHALAREHTALVCGMNLHLITALLDELGHRDVQTGLDPAPQRCCVTLTTAAG
jgi:predicted ArsR family transcriptional regulator